MFARIFALLPLALLVSAAHRQARQSGGECNTGSIQCCNFQKASDAYSVLKEHGLADILDGDSIVGSNCEGSGLVGVGDGTTCGQQPMCCNGNTFNGLVSIGCSPIGVQI